MDETHTREAWVGKLFFGSLLSQETLIHLFEVRIDQAEALAQELEIQRDQMDAYSHVSTWQGNLHLMTLDYGITMFRAQIDWMRAKLDIVRHFSVPDSDNNGNNLS